MAFELNKYYKLTDCSYLCGKIVLGDRVKLFGGAIHNCHSKYAVQYYQDADDVLIDKTQGYDNYNFKDPYKTGHYRFLNDTPIYFKPLKEVQQVDIWVL